jgi:tRNA pseudouridine38-40 synthase
MRYFLNLAYQGTNYSGWRRQVNTNNTIQQIIEDALSQMLSVSTVIHGCGRTDAGVHATEYYAHTDIENIPNYDFINRINHMLPEDVAIHRFIPVQSTAHAQYDATWRTYEYYFHLIKTPHLHLTSAYYNYSSLDFSSINEGLEIIQSTRDFRALCKHPDIYKNTDCIIKQIEIEKILGNECYKLTVTANRFLRGMIRYMIARLLDIGTGKLRTTEFKKQLKSKQSFEFPFHKQGHPQGLYLSKIEYSDSIFDQS